MRLTRRYVLISSWTLASPPEKIWTLLRDIDGWPRWWPQLMEVSRLGLGDSDGLGQVTRFTWRSGAGYRLKVTTTTVRMVCQKEIEAVADGDVSGRGLWLLEAHEANRVRITYRWDVELRRSWMRFLSPVLAALFTRRHFALMRGCAAGMARQLGCLVEDSRESCFHFDLQGNLVTV